MTTGNYKWLWVTRESFTYNHWSTFARIVGTSTSFPTGVKKKLEAKVSVMNHTNQLLLSLAKNRWMKLNESLSSILKYFFLCSRCKARYVSIQTCMNDYLMCVKFEVHDHVCKHAIRCTKKHVPRFLILEALLAGHCMCHPKEIGSCPGHWAKKSRKTTKLIHWCLAERCQHGRTEDCHAQSI